jgi:hypothetical protein
MRIRDGKKMWVQKSIEYGSAAYVWFSHLLFAAGSGDMLSALQSLLNVMRYLGR